MWYKKQQMHCVLKIYLVHSQVQLICVLGCSTMGSGRTINISMIHGSESNKDTYVLRNLYTAFDVVAFYSLRKKRKREIP